MCQVDELRSCGACCGLYNVVDTSFGAIREMLSYRSRRFAGTARDLDTILTFKQEIEARENQERPFPKFHHCPYLGLIGKHRSRVGCLLHPMAEGNRGVDFRGLSYYGGMACRDYFCPSAKRLRARYKTVVMAAVDDWYSYGLVVTELEFLTALLGKVEGRIGRTLEAGDLNGYSGRTAAVRDLLQLKIHWPFRTRSTGGGRCHYMFEDGIYKRSQIDYAASRCKASVYDPILRELETDLPDPQSLQQAEELIERHINRVAESFAP